MVEVEPNRIIKREDFGPGKLGDIAYKTIISGAPCETILQEEDNLTCERISDRTVDYDASGDASFITVCSDIHEEMTKARIRRDTQKSGRITAIGINGFGRA